jgi:N-acetylglucosaminyldiphosphoundecaprenol N-acetyl-beta-D-mannosaminyltransferase
MAEPSSRSAPDPDALPQVTVANVRVHAIRQPECVAFVAASLAAGRGGFIATANLDHLRRLQQPGPFRDVYAAADLVVADGMPLVWAAKLQGTPLPERVAGSDLIRSLSAMAAAHGRSVYLLGGDPGTADAAAAKLTSEFAGLRVAGTHCPAFGFERDPAAMAALRAQLAASRADVVFVALGSPKQELLIAALRDALPHAWWIGVGISFSFVAGQVKRAPRWMQRTGLEWSWRLLQEPRRLGVRYLWQGPPFVLRLLGGSLLRRGRAQPAGGASRSKQKPE